MVGFAVANIPKRGRNMKSEQMLVTVRIIGRHKKCPSCGQHKPVGLNDGWWRPRVMTRNGIKKLPKVCPACWVEISEAMGAGIPKGHY